MIGCANKANSKIKSSRELPIAYYFFVSKLEPSTSEQDLKDYLDEKDIVVQSITKLKPLQKWQEKSAAFKISISDISKNDILKADIWPDNVEVREWIFKPRA